MKHSKKVWSSILVDTNLKRKIEWLESSARAEIEAIYTIETQGKSGPPSMPRVNKE